MNAIWLPQAGGGRSLYRLSGRSMPTEPSAPPKRREVFAAAHVVADPWADIDVSTQAAIDWEATLAYREYLWSQGFAVAEAMDTAQRGMGLDWHTSQELIQRSVIAAAASHGAIACGAGTDHLTGAALSLDDVIHAYEEQCAYIEGCGGEIILMASRALAALARSADDYAAVYDTILRQVRRPVILHWLGAMFDPALDGYWGTSHPGQAMRTCLEIIQQHQAQVKGVKISLLNPELEMEMRTLLPPAVKMYTGDDFNYVALIQGDGDDFSHGMLGIFDPIAPVAAKALKALDRGDDAQYRDWLLPTVALSRALFQPPTRFYKTGIVFLAYLNGHQSHFRMVGGQEGMRSLIHLAEVFRLADQASLLLDPDVAIARMHQVLSLGGGD